MTTSHYLKTQFPPDVADVIFVGGIAIDGGQRERGGAAEDEPAVAGIDLALESGDGQGLAALHGRVEQVQGAIAAWR